MLEWDGTVILENVKIGSHYGGIWEWSEGIFPLGWQGTNASRAVGWELKQQLGRKMQNIAGSRSLFYGFEDGSVVAMESQEQNASKT